MALKDLIEKWDSPKDTERRNVARLLLEFHTGDWKKQVKARVRRQMAEETFQRMKLHIDHSWNISEYACSRIGAIYSKKVKRSIGGVDLEDFPEGQVFLNGGMLDVVMGTVHPLTLGVGNTFLRPMGVQDPITQEMSMVVDIITPDQCVVTEDPEDPNGITEIMYCIGSGDSARFVYWSAETHATLDKDFQIVPDPNNSGFVNPYNLVPVVPLRESYRVKDFFQHRTGGSLRETTLTAAVGLSNYQYRLKSGCFKQPVVAGKPNQDFPLDHILDSVTPLVLGPGGTATTLDLQSNYQQLLDVIIRRASTNLALHGFTDEALKGTVTAQSGIALRVMQTELSAAWDKQRTLYTFFEGDLLFVGRRVLQADLGVSLPEGPVEIEWPDVGPEPSPVDLANIYNPQVDRGMVPKWFASMKINKISEEEARRLVQEAQEERMAGGEMLPLIPSDVQMPGAAPTPQPNNDELLA